MSTSKYTLGGIMTTNQLPQKPYPLKVASKRFDIGLAELQGDVRAGRLKARLKRGQSKPYYVTDAIMEDYFENGFEEVRCDAV